MGAPNGLRNFHEALKRAKLLGNPACIFLTSRSDGPVDFQFDGAVVLPRP